MDSSGGGRIEGLFVLRLDRPQRAGYPGWTGLDWAEFSNPVGFIGAAWGLGDGFGFSAFIGGWAPVNKQLRKFGFDSWARSERMNLEEAPGSCSIGLPPWTLSSPHPHRRGPQTY